MAGFSLRPYCSQELVIKIKPSHRACGMESLAVTCFSALKHLVQTQRVHLITRRLKSLFSLKFGDGVVSRAATVVDLVKVKTSRLNSSQRANIFRN